MNTTNEVTIEFNYHARGFCCPNCRTGLSLTSKQCPYCGSKLKNPYEISTTDKTENK